MTTKKKQTVKAQENEEAARSADVKDSHEYVKHAAKIAMGDRLNEALASVAKLEGDLTIARNNARECERRAKEHKADLDECRAMLNAALGKAGALEDEVEAEKDRSSTAVQMSMQYKADLGECRRGLADRDCTLVAMRQRLEASTAEVEQLKVDCDALRGAGESAANRVRTLERERDALRRRLHEVECLTQERADDLDAVLRTVRLLSVPASARRERSYEEQKE